MTNPTKNSFSSRGVNNVSSHDLLMALSKQKWLYLILLAFIGATTFWLLKYQILTYTSEASFYMSETTAGTNVGQNKEFSMPSVLSPSEQVNRAYQLISSSKVHEHLIKKFNLLQHYGIDTTKEFHFEEAVAILESRIKIKKSPFDLIAIYVSDSHRYLAAEMANEAVRYLDVLNKDLMIRSMKQKLEVYEIMLKSTEKENAQRSIYLNRQMSDLNQILGRIEKQAVNSGKILELQSQLSQLISSLERSSDELTSMRTFHSLAIQSIQDKNLPSIVVVHKARPSHRSMGIQALLISASIVLLVLSGIIYSVYIKLRYKNYFRVLMNNKSELKQEEEHKAAP